MYWKTAPKLVLKSISHLSSSQETAHTKLSLASEAEANGKKKEQSGEKKEMCMWDRKIIQWKHADK